MSTQSPAAAGPASRADAVRGPLLVGAAGAGAALLLHLHDPHQTGSYGYCPFLELTGRPCPGCGGLRAVNDLTRGDAGAAVSSNALVVVLVVVLAVAWVRWTVLRARGAQAPRMIALGPRTGAVVLGVIVAFGVFRNTPWGAWFAP